MKGYVGIDVGGTNLKAGLVDETGCLLAVERVPLDFQSPEKFARTLAELSRSVAARGGVAPERICAVGVGLPGVVEGGSVRFTTNIPMEDVPLERLFRQSLDRPLLLGNDADCAAAGEYFCGVGKGSRDFVMVTLGTGVGIGLVLNGGLRSGAVSSEGGHLVTHPGGRQCNCGSCGCWEQYASGTALIRWAREAMEHHPESLLHTCMGTGKVDGRAVFTAAKQGDRTALELCEAYAEEVSSGVIGIINLLRPEILAIGGGIGAAPEELLLGPVRAAVEERCFFRHGGRVTQILPAQLGNDAGMIGAAMLGQFDRVCK